MAIRMTRAEYQQIYGQTPAVTTAKPESGGVNLGIKDAFKGGISQIKSGYEKALHSTDPGKTSLTKLFEGGTEIAAGTFNAAFSPLAPIMKPVEMGVNYTADKVGGIPAVQKFSESKAGEVTERVVGNVANLSAVAGGVAGVRGGAPVASKLATGAVETIKPAVANTGRVLKATGEGAYGITVTPGEGTARALQTYKESTPNLISRIKNTVTGETKGKPITESNTAARYGLLGTEQEIGVQAGRYMQEIWTDKIAPSLNKSKGTLDMKKFFSAVEKKIIDETPELTRRGDLIEGLAALKEQYSKVSRVKLPKLQAYKEGWTKTLPESSFKGKPIAGALKEVKKVASDVARDFIYKNVDENVKQDYIDYGNLKSIREAGIKSGIGDIARRGISLGIWQFIMDKAITPVATSAGKILYKTGEGLEFIGESGAKTVGDIVGKEVPNKQGGFLNVGDIAKTIDNTDKNIMTSFVDMVNQGKTPSKEVMAQAQKVADAMGLEEAFSSNKKLSEQFTKILDAERQKTKANMSKDLEPLAKEARKYKSAEEFAKNLSPANYRRFLNELSKGRVEEGGVVHKNNQYGNRKRAMGDYLYNQDRDMFNDQLSRVKLGSKDSLFGDLADFYNKAVKKSP